jgi:catalase
VEQAHIIAALRFELTKVQTQAVRERMVSVLANIDDTLAQGVADGLGFAVPPPQELAAGRTFEPPVEASPSLSLFARPGDGGVKGLRVALMVADGMDGAAMRVAHAALLEAGAVPRFIGVRLGAVMPDAGMPVHVEVTFETAPAAVWDAVVVPAGEAALATLAGMGQVMEFLRDQYRHCKPMLGFAGADMLMATAGIPAELPSGEADPGIVMADGEGQSSPRDVAQAVNGFMQALAVRRHFARELDPAPV